MFFFGHYRKARLGQPEMGEKRCEFWLSPENGHFWGLLGVQVGTLTIIPDPAMAVLLQEALPNVTEPRIDILLLIWWITQEVYLGRIGFRHQGLLDFTGLG